MFSNLIVLRFRLFLGNLLLIFFFCLLVRVRVQVQMQIPAEIINNPYLAPPFHPTILTHSSLVVFFFFFKKFFFHHYLEQQEHKTRNQN